MQARYQQQLALDVTYLDQCNTLFQLLSRVSNLITRESARCIDKSFKIVWLCNEADYISFFALMSRFKVRHCVCGVGGQYQNTETMVLGHLRKTLLGAVQYELEVSCFDQIIPIGCETKMCCVIYLLSFCHIVWRQDFNRVIKGGLSVPAVTAFYQRLEGLVDQIKEDVAGMACMASFTPESNTLVKI